MKQINIIPFLFIAAMALGFFSLVSGVFLDDTDSENRQLKERPQWNKNNALTDEVPRLLQEYAGYYRDHYPFKSAVFKTYAALQNCMGAEPLPRKVVHGTEGWMFLGDIHSNSIRESKGILKLSDDEVNKLKQNLTTLQHQMQGLNAPYYIAIARNKHSVYGEYLPITQQQPTLLHQFVAAAGAVQMPVVDMGELYAQHSDSLLYYKSDSHWNGWGAYWGYVALMQELQRQFPQLELIELSDLKVRQVNRQGGLNRLLDIPETERQPVLEMKEPRARKTEQLGRGRVRYKSNVNELKVLVWHDSFGPDLRRFLKESFGESVFISGYALDEELIRQEQPDLVIQQVVERKLDLYVSGLPAVSN